MDTVKTRLLSEVVRLRADVDALVEAHNKLAGAYNESMDRLNKHIPELEARILALEGGG